MATVTAFKNYEREEQYNMATNEDVMIKLTNVDSRCKSQEHRIDKIEERQDNLDSLVTSVATMATEQDHIKTDVGEIKTDVKALTEKPAKRWDGMVDKIIGLLVAGGIGFLLAQIGM